MRNRKKSGGDSGGGANWMDTYGDLVTLLLTFFVLLFASSSIDAERWQTIVLAFTGDSGGQQISPIDIGNPMSGGINSGDILQPSDAEQAEIEIKDDDSQQSLEMQRIEEQMNQLYQELKGYVEQQGMQEALLLSKDGMNVELTIAEGILFDSGRADIKDEDAEAVLNYVGDMLSQYLDSIKNITIEGHTDNVPISTAQFKDNLDLSSMRANNVARYMSGASGIGMDMFSSLGRGEWAPIASNDTEEGRQRNRRVNVIVTAKTSDDLPAAQPMSEEEMVTITSE